MDSLPRIRPHGPDPGDPFPTSRTPVAFSVDITLEGVRGAQDCLDVTAEAFGSRLLPAGGTSSGNQPLCVGQNAGEYPHVNSTPRPPTVFWASPCVRRPGFSIALIPIGLVSTGRILPFGSRRLTEKHNRSVKTVTPGPGLCGTRDEVRSTDEVGTIVTPRGRSIAVFLLGVPFECL